MLVLKLYVVSLIIQLDNDTVVETMDEKNDILWTVEFGIDISEFQESVEWDLMAVPAVRHYKTYTCCPEPSVDITYYIVIRRKTLFYTVNLIVPCGGITILTCVVFYLPSESNNKMNLSVSILVSLTVFFLLLVEIIPPMSLTVPLIGKFLLFTMTLVSLSVCVTVIVINIHYRSGTVHPMPTWMKIVFIKFLPKFIGVQRPSKPLKSGDNEMKHLRRKIDNLKTFQMHFETSTTTTLFCNCGASLRNSAKENFSKKCVKLQVEHLKVTTCEVCQKLLYFLFLF